MAIQGVSWYIVAWPKSEEDDPETSQRAILAMRTIKDKMGPTSLPRQKGEAQNYAGFMYSDISDLVGTINDTVKIPDWLLTLEIVAHGSPSGCGGINAVTIQGTGDQLKNVNCWGESCNIYLAGCNTGTVNPATRGTKDPRTSLARKLADAMPWNTGAPKPPTFWDHHLIVYGTNGYGDAWAASMTNLDNNMQTNPSVSVRDKKTGQDISYPPMDLPEGVPRPNYPAKGADCWIPNKNDSVQKW